jgi:transcriptional regulator with XRE-family HTH domain
MNTNNKFSEWLHREIRASGKSQSQLAYAGGISASQISRVLSGDRDPGADFCLAIARALNIDAETVFRRAGLLPADPEETPTLRQAMHLFRQLPPAQQRQKIAEMRAIIDLLESDRRIRETSTGGGK